LFGQLVPKGRTAFVNPDHGMAPYTNQWHLLENAQRVTQRQLDEIVEINDLDAITENRGHAESFEPSRCRQTYGLPTCAMRMLSEGVAENQRVSCFRLAVHLKRLGLPQDIAIATLKAWSAKNHPLEGKRIITEAEIVEQTSHAYARSYRSYGCEDPIIRAHCDATCPLVKFRDTTTGSHSRRA